MSVRVGKAFQTNRKPHITRADNVLDLKVRKLAGKAKLLDDTRVLSGSQLGVVLRLGTGHYHLARGKDQSGGLWLSNTHDHGCKTLLFGI